MPTGSLDGQRIGNYLVTRLLGEGGMGSVYLARHPEIEREVAIKVINSVMDVDRAGRFIDEARAATRIRHPNIIDIYDLGRTDEGRIYYVMEPLQGQELMEVMTEHFQRDGGMSPREVLPYLAQICHALQAAHDKGVVHRDLKPENIFVLRRKHLAIKILDFGLAKLLEREQDGTAQTKTGMIMGSPLVIAPEQAEGLNRKISPRTDIYSLGVILFWMMATRPPFANEGAFKLLSMHATAPPPELATLAPNTPAAIAALVMQCLEKQPDRRPSSARELLDRFAAALGEQPPEDVKDSLDAAWSAKTMPSPSADPGRGDGFALAMARTLPPGHSQVDDSRLSTIKATDDPAEPEGTWDGTTWEGLRSRKPWLIPAGLAGVLLVGGALVMANMGESETPSSVQANAPSVPDAQTMTAPAQGAEDDLTTRSSALVQTGPDAAVVDAAPAKPVVARARKGRARKPKLADRRPASPATPRSLSPDAAPAPPAPASKKPEGHSPEDDRLKEPNL